MMIPVGDAVEVIRDPGTNAVILRRAKRPAMHVVLSGPEWEELLATAKRGLLDPTSPTDSSAAPRSPQVD